MKITVKGFFTIKDAIGRKELVMEADQLTIREVLLDLSIKYGETFSRQIFDPQTNDVNTVNQILVNGRHYRHLPKGLDSSLKDGDELSLFPPVAGG